MGRYSTVIASPSHVLKPRISHKDLEEHFMSYVRQTPEYDIRNVGMNPLLLVPALFIPNSRNTVFDRLRRLRSQKFYVVSSSVIDKLSVMLSLLSTSIGLMLVARAHSVGAFKSYIFPTETHDPQKLRELASLNGFWVTRTWEIVKLIVASFPAITMWWRAFKRTSVPCGENSSFRVHKLHALAENNRLNKQALKDFSRRVSRSVQGLHLHSPNAALKANISALEKKLLIAKKEIEQLKMEKERLSLALEDVQVRQRDAERYSSMTTVAKVKVKLGGLNDSPVTHDLELR